jgi:flagellar basal-body rod modification protein FlgD
MIVGGTSMKQAAAMQGGEPSLASQAAAEGSASLGAGRSSAASKENPTEPKFGDVWKNIQAQYGAKAEKPREIKKTLGKDDFLRIMVTQMKHQDPTNPFKADQMAQQMAQYASVEQLQNMNQSMTKLTTQNQPLERLAMANLIGRSVTVDKERFPHTEGNKTPLSYVLPRDAAEARVSVIADSGEVVFSKELGPQKKGTGSVIWDGLKANTLPAKSGNYTFKIEAKDSSGIDIPIDPKANVRVVGISFEGKEPILLVGDPTRPEKVPMSSVSKIESDPSAGLIPGAQSLAQASREAGLSSASSSQSSPAVHEDALALHRAKMAERRGANRGINPAEPLITDEVEARQADAQEAAAAAAATPQRAAPNYFTFVKGEGSKNIDPAQIQDSLRAERGAVGHAPQEERGFPNGLGGE